MTQSQPTKHPLTRLGIATLSGLVLILASFFALIGPTVLADPIEPPDGFAKLNVSMKTVSPTLATTEGTTLTYVIELVNTGAYTAYSTTLTDQLPSFATYNGDAVASAGLTPTVSASDTLMWQGDVGFNATVKLTFSVVVSAGYSGVLSNTAVISQADMAEAVEVMAEATITDDPIFEISKMSAPEKPGANKALTLTLRVKNVGQPAVDLPVVLTDVVPVSTTVFALPDEASSDGSVVTWTRDLSLETGEETVFTYVVTVDDVMSGTVIANESYGLVSTPTGFVAGEVYTTTIIDPIFTLFKEIMPDPPGANRAATYRLTLLNTGSLATDLVITDTVPQYATYTSGGSANLPEDEVLWELASLDTGELAHFTYTVSISDIANVTLQNDDYAVCSAEGVCEMGNLLSSTIGAANFEIYVEVDPIAKKPGGGGGVVTPTVIVENVGPGSALDATVVLTFDRISFNRNDAFIAQPSPGGDPGTFVATAEKCPLDDKCVYFVWQGDLLYGEVITFYSPEGRSTIGGEEGINYTATVQVTDQLSTVVDGEWENYTTDPFTEAAVGKITHLAFLNPYKTAPSVIARGQVMTYTLEVWNSGLSNDAPPYPYLLDYIPEEVEILDISGGGVYTDVFFGTGSLDFRKAISWTLPALSTGERVYYTVTVRVDNNLISGTHIVNEYEVFWYENDPTLVGFTSTTGLPVTTTVREIGLIDSFKTVEPQLADPGIGTVLTYVLNIANTSDLDANNIVLTDELPWEVSTYQQDAVASSGSVEADYIHLVWQGSVAAHSTEYVTYTVVVDDNYKGPVSNAASITQANLLSPVDISAVAYITDEPILQISKRATPNPVNIDENLMYTLRVANLGQLAHDVVITDVIPANTTYVPGSVTGGGSLTGDTMRWELALLNPGQVRNLSFMVTVNEGSQVVNREYGIASAEGVSAVGEPVVTVIRGGLSGIYLPIVLK